VAAGQVRAGISGEPDKRRVEKPSGAKISKVVLLLLADVHGMVARCGAGAGVGCSFFPSSFAEWVPSLVSFGDFLCGERVCIVPLPPAPNLLGFQIAKQHLMMSHTESSVREKVINLIFLNCSSATRRRHHQEVQTDILRLAAISRPLPRISHIAKEKRTQSLK
jgi:hypothetical protein